MTHKHQTCQHMMEIFEFCSSNRNMPGVREETFLSKTITKQEPDMLCLNYIKPFSAGLKNFLNRIIATFIYCTSINNCISTMHWVPLPGAVQMCF